MIKETFRKPNDRLSKEDYYREIARIVSERSPCLKRKVGAVIVKDGIVIATGYNGPVRGHPHCEVCNRLDIPSGKFYIETCPAVHAEENAIINSARHGTCIDNGDIYLF